MATLASPTLGKLITNVRNMLNQPNPSNSYVTDHELTEYLNQAVMRYFTEVCHNDEGFFTAKTNLDIVSDSETVALPTDCFKIKTLRKKVHNGFEALDYRNDVTLGYTTQGGTNSNSYLPYYYLRANNIVLRPTPNFSETAGLELEYIQFPDTMVNGGDTMTAQVAPIFKELIEMYAVYKAKLKESLTNGTAMHTVAEGNLNSVYEAFKEVIVERSKNPTYVLPFNPELF